MSAWLRGRGVKEASVLSYSTRLREFAVWYRGNRGSAITIRRVTDDVVDEYEDYLRPKCESWTQVVARLSAVRTYNRWAVETGRLPPARLLVGKTVSTGRPRLKKRRPSDELYEGAEAYDQWLKARGRSLGTISGQSTVLRSLGRWCVDGGRGRLRPEIATPALVDEYWESSGRSKQTLGQGVSSVHSYVLWGLECGRVAEDPFAEVLGRRRRGTGGGWKLISPKDKDAFLGWIASVSGIGIDEARRKVQGVSRFLWWFYFTRGGEMRREDATPELLESYRRFLYQVDRPPKKRHLLSGSTISSYMHAARWFVRWASSSPPG